MSICVSKVLVGAAGVTADFDLTQHLNSIVMVSCEGSDTAGNNILRFYEVTPVGVFNLLGSAAAFADTITGPTLVAATATTPAYMRFTIAGAGEAATGAIIKAIGANFIK